MIFLPSDDCGIVISQLVDPYYKWLAIPSHEQSPNHYRLLGLDLFEQDPDVIDNAADKCMAHLRSFQTGKYAQDAQKLLNEVSAARVCFVNENQRAAYDANLRQMVAGPLRPLDVVNDELFAESAPAPLPSFTSAQPAQSMSRRVKRTPGRVMTVAAAVVVVMLLGIGVVVMNVMYGQGEPIAKPNGDSPNKIALPNTNPPDTETPVEPVKKHPLPSNARQQPKPNTKPRRTYLS